MKFLISHVHQNSLIIHIMIFKFCCRHHHQYRLFLPFYCAVLKLTVIRNSIKMIDWITFRFFFSLSVPSSSHQNKVWLHLGMLCNCSLLMFFWFHVQWNFFLESYWDINRSLFIISCINYDYNEKAKFKYLGDFLSGHLTLLYRNHLELRHNRTFM